MKQRAYNNTADKTPILYIYIKIYSHNDRIALLNAKSAWDLSIVSIRIQSAWSMVSINCADDATLVGSWATNEWISSSSRKYKFPFIKTNIYI